MTPLELYQHTAKPLLQGARVFQFPFGDGRIDHLNASLWSVVILGEDGAMSDGFGYGADLNWAQTSAWGECIEWLGERAALRKAARRFATFAALEADNADGVVDPRACNLEAGSDYSPETPLEWIEVARFPDGAKKWIPIEFVAPRYADIEPNADKSRFVSVPLTNGSGAGPTFQHALSHGILELLQRDGNSASYRAMDRGIRIELDEVQNPQTRELLAYLERENIEVIAKVAATDFGMANVYVVGFDRDLERARLPITLSACGEAVHPDREFALAKALREFVMARSRKAFNHGPLEPVRKIAPDGYLEAFRPSSMRSEDDRALREMQGWMNLSHEGFFEMLRDPVFQIRETVRFSDLPHTPVENARALLDFLHEQLSREQLEILFFDCTPQNAPATILKVVVPGLEVETMTYERIGARNLKRLLERGSPLVGEGAPPAGAKPVRLSGENDRKFWFSSTQKEQIVGALYPLYREPGRHVIGFLQEH